MNWVQFNSIKASMQKGLNGKIKLNLLSCWIFSCAGAFSLHDVQKRKMRKGPSDLIIISYIKLFVNFSKWVWCMITFLLNGYELLFIKYIYLYCLALAFKIDVMYCFRILFQHLDSLTALKVHQDQTYRHPHQNQALLLEES